jgi:ubiquitin C-terminal hydrolase
MKVIFFNIVKNTSLASTHVKAIVNMFDSSGEQNDAHEFMVFLFDRLNDEMLLLAKITGEEKKVSVANDEMEWEEVKKGGKRMKQVNTEDAFNISVIGKIFQGVLRHELEMKGKSVSKCTIEPFFILSLDFGENSIESCFKKYFMKRRIEDNNCSISQKTYFDKLPQVLIVHLKAFYYDKEIKQIVKINKKIDYETNLTLDKAYLTPSKVGDYGLKYDLISGKLL